MNTVKGMDLFSYERRLSKLGLFSLSKGKLEGRGNIVSVCQYLFWGGRKKVKADSSQCCPMKGQEVMGTDWHTGNSL